MEFRLDEGQVELQQTVARFCADHFPLDTIAAREGQPTDRALWTEMAALGIFELLDSEELGVLDVALVFEQLGSYLVPGPVLWTVLAAPLIPGAATGEVLVSGVISSDLIEHANDVDVILVVDGETVVAYDTADLPAPEPMQPLDPLTPVGRVTGLGSGQEMPAGNLSVVGTVLSAAMLSGIASRALDVAQSYAKERHQFGVPIGSFQAVKHLLADMYVRSGLAQSATYAAAAVLQEPGDVDPARAASTAKLLAAEAALVNASTAIQILGGMGFTWDMLPNYLLKRAWVLEHSFGGVDFHATALGGALIEATG